MLMTLYHERATKRPCKDKGSYLPSHATNSTMENFKPCLQSEYPLVKYWTRQQWKDEENSNKDASDILDNKDKTRRGTRSAKGENVMMLYIEHKDGMPIDGTLAAQIREYARSIWRDLYRRGKAPEKWSDAFKKVREEYFCEMEERWEVLRYCNNHWKVNKLATALYSIWYNQYHKKIAKTQGGNPHEGHPNQKARTSSVDLEDSPESEDQGSSSRPKPRPLRDPL
jgi:hypothetical protein